MLDKQGVCVFIVADVQNNQHILLSIIKTFYIDHNIAKTASNVIVLHFIILNTY